MKRTAHSSTWLGTLVAAIICLSGSQSAFAINNPTWTDGSGDENWNNTANWSGLGGGTPPFANGNDSITINGGSTALTPIVHSSGTDGSRGLNFESGYLNLTGGSIGVGSIGGGSIGSSGGTAQLTIGSGTTFGNQQSNLAIGNGSGSTGSVIINGGTLSGQITVGASSGTGTITGNGSITVGVNPYDTHTFTNNGKVTASGGTLSISNLNSAADILGSGGSSGHGWFATNSGTLTFAGAGTNGTNLSGSGTYIWGGPSTETPSTLDLVNSAALSYTSGSGATLTGNLLALNLTPVAAPTGVTFLDLWNISKTGTLTLSGLSIRFDDVAANGQAPTLYYDNGSAWVPLSTSDTSTIASYTGGSALSFGDFALGVVPEPSTDAMLLGGLLLLGLAVRRRQTVR